MKKLDVHTWASTVLPEQLRSAWNDADALDRLIRSALEAGVPEAVTAAVRRLGDLDKDSERAGTALGAWALSRGDRQLARRQLERVLQAFPKSATALANLSRLDEMEGRSSEARDKARRALALVPNHEGVFGWWHALTWKRARASLRAELEELAALPNTWRARLALAELLLTTHEQEKALTYYRQACLAADGALPALVAVVDSMHARRLTRDVVAVLGDTMATATVDPQVAIVVARSFLLRGEPEVAARQLTELQRSASPEALAPFAGELSELQRALKAERSAPEPSIKERSIVPIAGPIWLAGLGNPPVLQRRRGLEAPSATVGLLAWSVARDGFVGSEVAGPLSRGVPLALAERLWATTTVTPVTLLPVVLGRGLVRWTTPLTIEAIAACARVLPQGATLVAGHVHGHPHQLQCELWVLSLGTTEPEALTVTATSPDELYRGATAVITEALKAEGVATSIPEVSGLYSSTAPPDGYLELLDSLAVQLLAKQRVIDPDDVRNEAFVPERYRELIASHPNMDGPVLMAAASLMASVGRRPSLVAELLRLLQELPGPLPEPVEHIVRLAASPSVASEVPPALSSDDGEWLRRVIALFEKR